MKRQQSKEEVLVARLEGLCQDQRETRARIKELEGELDEASNQIKEIMGTLNRDKVRWSSGLSVAVEKFQREIYTKEGLLHAGIPADKILRARTVIDVERVMVRMKKRAEGEEQEEVEWGR